MTPNLWYAPNVDKNKTRRADAYLNTYWLTYQGEPVFYFDPKDRWSIEEGIEMYPQCNPSEAMMRHLHRNRLIQEGFAVEHLPLVIFPLRSELIPIPTEATDANAE